MALQPTPDLRSALEAAYSQHAAAGATPGAAAANAPAADDGDEAQGHGPVTRDAFSFETKAKEAENCSGCTFFEADESGCGLYDKLNQTLPDVFGLDAAVKPTSWCKAYTEGEEPEGAGDGDDGEEGDGLPGSR